MYLAPWMTGYQFGKFPLVLQGKHKRLPLSQSGRPRLSAVLSG